MPNRKQTVRPAGVRLFQVIRELNIAADTIVDTLREHGFELDATLAAGNVNARLEPAMYATLVETYSDDAEAKARVREIRARIAEREDLETQVTPSAKADDFGGASAPSETRRADSTEALATALAACQETARADYRYAREHIEVIERRLEDLQADAARTARSVRAQAGAETSRTVADAQTALGRIAADHVDKVFERLATLHQQLGRFTVVLFGRTMAGKSSLREAITGGDGTTIGRGATRTTREVHEYTWSGLRIVDTPGIGAFGGEEDREKALALVGEADFLLFLVSTDGIQEETFQGLRHVHEQRKPFAVVLNWKANLDVSEYPDTFPELEDFMDAPDGLLRPDALDGHLDRIRLLTTKHLQASEPEVHVVHAQAAFLATHPRFLDAARGALASRPDLADQVSAESLTKQSRLPKLLTRLRDEVVQRGRARRTQTLVGSLAHALDAARTDLRTTADYLQAQADAVGKTARRLDRVLDGFRTDAKESVRQQVQAKLKPLRNGVSSFVDDNIQQGDIQSRWKKRAAAHGLSESGQKAWQKAVREGVVQDLAEAIQEFASDVQVEGKFYQTDTGEAEHHDPFDVRRVLGRLTAGIAAAATLVAAFATGLGEIAGLVAIVSGIAGFFFSFFKSKEEKLREKKAALSQKLRAKLDSEEATLTAALQAWVENDLVATHARPLVSDAHAVSKAISALAAHTRAAADALDVQSAEVNRHFVRRLLLSVGSRPRFEAIRSVYIPPEGPVVIVSESPTVLQHREALAAVLGRPVTITSA